MSTLPDNAVQQNNGGLGDVGNLSLVVGRNTTPPELKAADSLRQA